MKLGNVSAQRCVRYDDVLGMVVRHMSHSERVRDAKDSAQRHVRWERPTGHFVSSKCGLWHITPIYGGLTRPESYELWFGAEGPRRRAGSGSTQRECKACICDAIKRTQGPP